MDFLNRFSENTHVNPNEIRPLGAELFHADGQTYIHDEANSGFFEILKMSLKISERQGFEITLGGGGGVKRSKC